MKMNKRKTWSFFLSITSKKNLWRYIFLLIFLQPLYVLCFGQEVVCDKQLEPIRNADLAYKMRDNRCEGFYISPVSGGLELVSLIIGDFRFELKSGTILEVSSPLFSSEPVNIRAQAIPLKTYYRMDSIVHPQKSMSWPVDSVLLPKKLHADRIGVYGWIGEEENKEFVPLRIGTKDSPLASCDEIEQIIMILRSTYELETLYWRLGNLVSDKCSNYGEWQSVPKSHLEPGWPIHIFLPLEPRNNLCVEVKARLPSRKTPVGRVLVVRLKNR